MAGLEPFENEESGETKDLSGDALSWENEKEKERGDPSVSGKKECPDISAFCTRFDKTFKRT